MERHATSRRLIHALLVPILLVPAACAASVEGVELVLRRPDPRPEPAAARPAPVEEDEEDPEAPPPPPPEDAYDEVPAPEVVPAEPSPDDPTLTAGGALRLFMASRNYSTLRALKSVMTESLQSRYDHDSAPFNGKNRVRLAAFHFTPDDLNPVIPRDSKGRPPDTYIAHVKTLWADQGEVVERRTEAIRVVRTGIGLWRVSRLQEVASESLRYRSDLQGLIALRRIMRGWIRRSLPSVQRYFSSGFERRYAGREEDLASLFVGRDDPRHAAYRIVELKEVGDTRLVARLELYDTSPGQPAPIEGRPVILQLVRQAPYWLLDSWERG